MIAETGNNKTSGTGTAVSITHGLTINSGDVIVVFLVCNGAQSGAMVDNNGATPFTTDYEHANGAVSADGRVGFFSRVAGASEPSAYAFTLTDSNTWSLIIRVFSGVDNDDVWDIIPSATTDSDSNADGTTATAPSITTLTDNALGMAFFNTDSSSITYSGYTNDYITEVEVAGVNPVIASVIKQLPTAGVVGTVAATLSGSNDWTATQCALKAAADPPVVSGGEDQVRGGIVRSIYIPVNPSIGGQF